MKAIGIDFGEARIGIAVSDDLGITARPLKTIAVEGDPEDAIPQIVTIVEAEEPEVVVVGHPIRMDGSVGESALKVEAWAEILADELPSDVGIELLDERLSTVDAEKKIKEMQKGSKTKKKASVDIDSAAAAVILQDFLDEQQESGPGDEILADIGKGRRDPSLAAFEDDDDGDFSLDDDDEDDFSLDDDDDDDDEDDDDEDDEYDEDGDDRDRNSDFGYGGIWNGQDDD